MQEKEIHLRDYIKVIRKRKNIVYTFFIITFTLVLIGTFSSSRESVYKASTRVLVEKSDPSSLIEGSSMYYKSWDPEFLETQARIITGSSVASRVVKSLALDTTYRNLFIENEPEEKPSALTLWFRGVMANFSKAPETGNVDAAGPQFPSAAEKPTDAEIIVEMITGGIELTPVRDTRIIDISFTFKNPVVAQMIVNNLVESYINELLDMRMQAANYAIDWMSTKAEEERLRLEKSEKDLSNYMRAKDIITIEDKIAIVPEKVSSLSDELTKAETRRKELESVTDKIRKLTLEEAEAIPEIASSQALQDLRKEITKAEQTVTEYSKKYGRKHPLMIRSENALELLQDTRTNEVRRLIKEIINDYELARSNEKNLSTFLNQAKSESNNLNDKYIQYKILKRDVETNRNLYNALVGKIKEQTVAEKIQTVNVWTVEAAKIPGEPVSTHKKRKLLLGLLLGLFGGIGLAFFIEYLDNTIKSVEETEERLGVPVLGVISHMQGKGADIEHAVSKDPLSLISENYKAVRTSILLSSADRPPACLLVTSMAPREGKTTTVSNIASALAQSGKKVVVLDADLRRPRIHNVFDVPNQKGLSSYLAGNSEPVFTEIPQENLRLMTSGPIPPDPSELLGSKRLEELIVKLRKIFDVIILDSPPLLSVSDALILSKLSDGVLIVARAGQTNYEIARKGIKQLRDVKAHITGLIINDADLKKDAYDYYSGYGSYYTYREAEESAR